jgi:SlyX protein
VIDEQRIIELEIKLTRQEDLAQELSLAVYRQQKQIDELQALCRLMAKRLDDGSSGADPYAQEKPPHY